MTRDEYEHLITLVRVVILMTALNILLNVLQFVWKFLVDLKVLERSGHLNEVLLIAKGLQQVTEHQRDQTVATVKKETAAVKEEVQAIRTAVAEVASKVDGPAASSDQVPKLP